MSVIMLYPLLVGLSSSLSSRYLYLSPILRIEDPSLKHYTNIWPLFRKYMFNSLFVASSVAIAGTFLNSMAAYGLSKTRFWGRNSLFLCILSTMIIPVPVTITPLYVFMSKINWINTYQCLILPDVADAFSIFLLIQFFKSIPNELLDSGRVDGCSHFRMYWNIILPISGPALCAVALIKFMTNYNSLIWPYITITSDSLRTLPVAIMTYTSTPSGVSPADLIAGSLLSAVPMILLFLFLQRYFIAGIQTTGIKA